MPRKEITRSEYIRRVGLILDYIYKNLDGDLSLEKIAEVSCFSKFHCHRIYQSIADENIASTIRRLRLQRAARSLAESNMSVSRISRSAGYTHPDSFIRKFSQDFGYSPAEYRKRNLLVNPYQPKIELTPTLELAAIQHRGDYMMIGSAFTRLRVTGKEQCFLTEESRAFGIFYSDPTIVKEKDLQSKACYTLNGNNTTGEEIEHISLESQTYATIIHQGPHHELDAAYRWLYGVWLIESGYEPADEPVLEEYLNSPRFVAPTDLLTKIYLPLIKE